MLPSIPAPARSFRTPSPRDPIRRRLACAAPVLVASLLTGCLHRPDPDAMTRAAPAPTEAALLAAAERVVLDPVAFEAARQRAPAAPRAETPVAARPPAAPTVRRLSVAFGTASTRLAADQAVAVQQLVRDVDRNAQWRVVAHPEAVGGRQTRQRMARLRADRVVEHLMRAGVDRRAITVAPPGDAGASNAEPQSLPASKSQAVALARRVDIEVTDVPAAVARGG